ncbi:MAG: ornithine--oxo-acid transaminase [Candidatus Yanofskybacteria bacterium RIFCSPHIGHO2_02_FULL_41_11]|uniref:ornithine aminotransferase n=1 Tax=Candidatus Yanofskybacteria bacterium RIFCSPHIGHO2_02_FULL_41_11 TaxID=1802675 RepID=A0A1F8F9E7_9BACT|nr:MAG: ornithine--oxo-acid transaminase [Candidatus Yanofskybacteria bacterium RIFCSPHIGHO2_02_FULL_41_11]
MDTRSLQIIEEANKFAANNYDPLPIVIESGMNVWAYDTEGKCYVDCLSCYSALNFGYNHPRLIKALNAQADKVCVTSRAVHTKNLGEFCREVSKLCGLDKVLPMNTGAEGVETAIKIARKWGYKVKRVQPNQANIIVCDHNFHGRTTTVISFSSEDQYRDGFGPLTPGFKSIPFGDVNALSDAIDGNAVAFLVEPIQGEGGVNVPPKGYLADVERVCRNANILMVVDEVQTGFGRTGYDLAYQHDNVLPDMVILGKALGGGILPVSAVVAKESVMEVIKPGDHGSTFGGNPLACAVGIEAIRLLKDARLSKRSEDMGSKFISGLRKIKSNRIKDIRGRGLMIGIELVSEDEAKSIQHKLLKSGILAGKSRNVLRINPPLIINKTILGYLLTQLEIALTT